MTDQAAVHRALADPQRAALLAALGEESMLGATELGRRVGLHANTARWHLAILAEAGLVGSHVEHRGTPGRPRRVWKALRLHDGGGGQRELSRALVSIAAASPRARTASEAAGRAWGRGAARGSCADDGVTEVVRVLDQHGFEPRAEGLQVTMERSPFADLARESPEVVCGIHRGLVEGVLAEAGSTLVVERLEVFPRPGVCVLRLGETDG
jgi:predicted ArsR family transcriptional regulator